MPNLNKIEGSILDLNTYRFILKIVMDLISRVIEIEKKMGIEKKEVEE
jgi:hypothetical protein